MREMARGIDATPYLEWLDGVETDAVSPNTPHGIVAMTIAEMFNRRGDSFGLALPEVHLRLNDTPGKRTVLLPGVAFYRADTLRALDPADRLLPNVRLRSLSRYAHQTIGPDFGKKRSIAISPGDVQLSSTSIHCRARSSCTHATACGHLA
ncbi:MAG: hypothetical protein WA629_10875 [Candidatus Aquilonibacter sp.]